jgi:hypothetical protein
MSLKARLRELLGYEVARAARRRREIGTNDTGKAQGGFKPQTQIANSKELAPLLGTGAAMPISLILGNVQTTSGDAWTYDTGPGRVIVRGW